MLDSDYSYLNEDLAALYGVKGVTGPALRKVALGDRRRGGLVGMAIAMQKTSMPNRTSPTIRGKWVLDSLLGQPPPPPPDDVNNADVDSKKPNPDGKVLSFREKLDLHARTGSACVNCHRKIDPIGFSLENFDPLGRYRDKLNGRPVFNSGQLPDGTKLQGVESVKKVLLARQDMFLRNLVQHLLTYALGRDLQSVDLPTVHRITQDREGQAVSPGRAGRRGRDELPLSSQASPPERHADWPSHRGRRSNEEQLVSWIGGRS